MPTMQLLFTGLGSWTKLRVHRRAGQVKKADCMLLILSWIRQLLHLRYGQHWVNFKNVCSCRAHTARLTTQVLKQGLPLERYLLYWHLLCDERSAWPAQENCFGTHRCNYVGWHRELGLGSAASMQKNPDWLVEEQHGCICSLMQASQELWSHLWNFQLLIITRQHNMMVTLSIIQLLK